MLSCSQSEKLHLPLVTQPIYNTVRTAMASTGNAEWHLRFSLCRDLCRTHKSSILLGTGKMRCLPFRSHRKNSPSCSISYSSAIFRRHLWIETWITALHISLTDITNCSTKMDDLE